MLRAPAPAHNCDVRKNNRLVPRMKKYLVLFVVSYVLIACGTVTHYAKRPDFSLISMGMSQQKVIEALGKPEDISAQSGVVYLTYTYAPWYDHDGADGNKEFYFVRLINDKVESYGKKGDFDSTKPPEQTININVNEKSESK